MFPQFQYLLRAIICGVIFGFAQLVFGSEVSPWFVRAWLTEHGLPDNNVSSVAQAADGYLWVGTHNGLARFDGLQFTKIPLPAVAGRTDLLIRTLLVADDKTLWLAAEGGVVMQLSQDATNVFTSASGLSKYRPTALAQESSGAIWVGYTDGSACKIFRGTVKRFFNLPGNGICSLAADVAGQVWFARGGRISVFRTNQFVTLLALPETAVRLRAAKIGGMWICAGARILKFNEGSALVSAGQIVTDRGEADPTVVFEDRLGAVWIGTGTDGLFHFDGTKMVRADTSHREILDVNEDSEGSLWVGTGGGGLNRLRPRVLELQGLESGLPAESIRSVCEDDSTEIIWAVAQNGGLARFADGAWKNFSKAVGWPDARATCVTSDSKGGVWIGTYHGGLAHWQNGQFAFLQRRDGLASEIAHALLMDRQGNLWIGWESTNCLQCLQHGKFITFTQTPGSQTIRTLAEDAAGDIWAGTSDGYLFRANGDKLVDETTRTVSPPIPIRCLFAPPTGGLWIGYAGGGIGRLHDGKFARITTRNGLYDDGICLINADNAGSYWLGSDHGIFQVKENELEAVAAGRAEKVTSIVYGRDEMQPNLQAAYGFAPNSLRSRDGRLWFSTRTGIAVIRPDRVHANRIPPLVHIERVLVDGQSLNLVGEQRLRLPPKHHKVEFEIAALSFIAPENVRWKYRLDNLDDDWVEGGAQRSATYPQLPASSYNFRVIACNSAGVWNDAGAHLVVVVAPFFWQTWWFRSAALGVFTFGVVAVVRYVSFRRLRTRVSRLEQETALQRDRARIAQDLHDDLGASLTHIALLSELAQNDLDQQQQAKNHIDEIFRTARSITRSLDEIVWSVSPKNDTLDRFVAHLSTYALEVLRATGVRARLDWPEELPVLELPSEVRHHLYLAIKEALHNIVKHAGATEVWLRLRLTPTAATVIIEDDGRGFEPVSATAPDADGLANFRQRMDEVGGRCEQQSRPGHGTITTFTVPLKKQSSADEK